MCNGRIPVCLQAETDAVTDSGARESHKSAGEKHESPPLGMDTRFRRQQLIISSCL